MAQSIEEQLESDRIPGPGLHGADVHLSLPQRHANHEIALCSQVLSLEVKSQSQLHFLKVKLFPAFGTNGCLTPLGASIAFL